MNLYGKEIRKKSWRKHVCSIPNQFLRIWTFVNFTHVKNKKFQLVIFLTDFHETNFKEYCSSRRFSKWVHMSKSVFPYTFIGQNLNLHYRPALLSCIHAYATIDFKCIFCKLIKIDLPNGVWLHWIAADWLPFKIIRFFGFFMFKINLPKTACF